MASTWAMVNPAIGLSLLANTAKASMATGIAVGFVAELLLEHFDFFVFHFTAHRPNV